MRGLLAILVLALLALLLYTGYAGTAVYQRLDVARQELVAAQASLNAGVQSGDAAQLHACAYQLGLAESDFGEAGRRSKDDFSLRLLAALPLAGRNLDSVTHLSAIGVDISRAGEAAASVAIQVAGLKQQYAGRTLTPDDLQVALQQAQAIARDYSASTQAIGRELRAAHAERAQVTTTNLVGPLRDAYDAVDRALGEADSAFLRFQDVRKVLSDLLGVRLAA